MKTDGQPLAFPCESVLLRAAWICLVFLCGAADGLAEAMLLPDGDAPAAVVSRHFPDRGHEFVWRNWGAVDPAKLAKILGASMPHNTVLAVAMGSPPDVKVPPEPGERGYLTLIRRNWHLLPYEQLLELLKLK